MAVKASVPPRPTATHIPPAAPARSKKGNTPKSVAIFEEGVKTSADFCKGMSLLMGDLITGRVTSSVGNAIVNAGGKMLKAIELKERFGRTPKQTETRELVLAKD